MGCYPNCALINRIWIAAIDRTAVGASRHQVVMGHMVWLHECGLCPHFYGHVGDGHALIHA